MVRGAPWLITLIAETLVPQVRPEYRVAIEKRIYEVGQPDNQNGHSLLVGMPDVSVHRQSAQQALTPQLVTALIAFGCLRQVVE